jgi:decaprenyl-phosphate phosphoribosyltransferase
MIDLFQQVFLACRPKQWIKNALVFALPLSDGMIIGHSFKFNVLLRGLFAFTSLSWISSANYIINDIFDIKMDKNHPTKSYRPIASGKLSVSIGILTALILSILSLGLCRLTLGTNTFISLALFGLLQFLYSCFFKHQYGFDLVVLATLYVVRALIPTLYEKIQISQWFFIIFFASALFLVAGKRYSEIQNNSFLKTRKVLGIYSKTHLQIWISVSLSLLVVSYLNWIFTFSKHPGFVLMLTSMLPMSIILIRISVIALTSLGEDPSKFVFNDKANLTLLIIWGAMYMKGKGYI